MVRIPECAARELSAGHLHIFFFCASVLLCPDVCVRILLQMCPPHACVGIGAHVIAFLYNVCVCVCVCVCMCIHIYVCIDIYTHMHVMVMGRHVCLYMSGLQHARCYICVLMRLSIGAQHLA